MNAQQDGWDPEVHRYLDGESDAAVEPQARAEADRFRDMVARYTAELTLPGPKVDDAVLAAVRPRAPAARARIWRRRLGALLATPVRPLPGALAVAAALVVAAGVSFWIPGASDDADRVTIAPLAPPTVPVQFEADFPYAEQVNLAGSFNGWDAAATPLSRHPETGRWVATLRLAPGWHEYLFVVDGMHWVPDPAAGRQVVAGGDTSSAVFVAPP